jgi:dinuclear metal center YbgI/SA1388 family protein
MIVEELKKYLESWAPSGIAWDKDNVGLQVGSSKSEINNILLCLEVNSRVVDDAIKRRCNLIISHHPLIFSPIKSITNSDKISELIKKLIKNDINLFSAHTNLDFTKDGVSFQLAKRLKLKNIRFLKHLSSNQFKVAVFVPENFVEKVASAMHEAGGGQIGDYSNCSFRIEGIGTFKGSDSTNPFIGIKGNLEYAKEVRLEMVVNSFHLPKVIKAMIENHPYEEVAYDVYQLQNDNVNYGMGAIGELENSMTKDDFLNYVSECLKIKNFRYTNGSSKKIKTVAVCGGSGSDLASIALKKDADAFITSDIKYHKFQEFQDELLLIDAGHYETEIFILDELEKRITSLSKLNNDGIKVFRFKGSTNPIIFYNKLGEKIV